MATAAGGSTPLTTNPTARGASRRRWVHAGMLGWALLLRWLSAPEAAALAGAALLFNWWLLPRLAINLAKPMRLRSEQPAAGAPQAASPWRGIRLYPFTVLLLIVLFPGALYLAGAGWAVLALGDPAASWWGQRGSAPGARPYFHPEKSWRGTLAYFLAAWAGAGFFLAYLHAPAGPARLALAAALGALVAALIEALPLHLDDNFLPPLAATGVMALALTWPLAPRWAPHAIEGVIVCSLFALAARGLRLVSTAGAAAGWGVALALYWGLGRGGFACLLAFFALGAAATKFGYARKARLGAAEGHGGRRGWSQVLANGLVPALAGALGLIPGARPLAAVAAVAALAEAASDTLASELGEALATRAYLIGAWQPVALGTDGGVSIAGTLAGAAGAAVLAALGAAVGLVTWPAAAVIAAIGLAGNLWDSVLGAVWERRGELSNDEVNFLATLAAALAAMVVLRG